MRKGPSTADEEQAARDPLWVARPKVSLDELTAAEGALWWLQGWPQDGTTRLRPPAACCPPSSSSTSSPTAQLPCPSRCAPGSAPTSCAPSTKTIIPNGRLLRVPGQVPARSRRNTHRRARITPPAADGWRRPRKRTGRRRPVASPVRPGGRLRHLERKADADAHRRLAVAEVPSSSAYQVPFAHHIRTSTWSRSVPPCQVIRYIPEPGLVSTDSSSILATSVPVGHFVPSFDQRIPTRETLLSSTPVRSACVKSSSAPAKRTGASRSLLLRSIRRAAASSTLDEMLKALWSA